VSRLARRLTVTLAALIAAILIAGCAGAPGGQGVVTPRRPDPTPIADPSQPYGPYPTLPATGGEPPVGNTDRHYPELSVSLDGGYLIDVVDPAARAWWIVVTGTGVHAGDRLEIVAEVGDIWPGAAVRVYVGGELVDETDMNGLIDNDTAIAGGCHPTLDLCFSSGGLHLDADTGRFAVTLEGNPAGPFEVRGATASWDGEPYVLGPWRGTETVPAG
jgi:hypothetical protein